MKRFRLLLLLVVAAIGCSTEAARRQVEQPAPRSEIVPAVRGAKFLSGKAEVRDVAADGDALTILVVSHADTALALKCRFVWLDEEQREIRKVSPEWLSITLIPNSPTPVSSAKPAEWASCASLEVREDRPNGK